MVAPVQNLSSSRRKKQSSSAILLPGCSAHATYLDDLSVELLNHLLKHLTTHPGLYNKTTSAPVSLPKTTSSKHKKPYSPSKSVKNHFTMLKSPKTKPSKPSFYEPFHDDYRYYPTDFHYTEHSATSPIMIQKPAAKKPIKQTERSVYKYPPSSPIRAISTSKHVDTNSKFKHQSNASSTPVLPLSLQNHHSSSTPNNKAPRYHPKQYDISTTTITELYTVYNPTLSPNWSNAFLLTHLSTTDYVLLTVPGTVPIFENIRAYFPDTNITLMRRDQLLRDHQLDRYFKKKFIKSTLDSNFY
jgi:hypothetical protein